MESTCASSSNTELEPETENTTISEEIFVEVAPSTSTTTSLTPLFSSCFNFCSLFLSLCSTGSYPNAFQDESVPSPSPSDTHAFEQVVPSTSISARSAVTPHRNLSYDVFINHRGPDVKHTLADKLYVTLTGMGLTVFLDNEELQFGDFLPTNIEEAMRSASLHIALFSKNYAHSPWCLAELSFMLRTGTQIFPVFYHVQPDDVRYAKGVYGEAFSRYLKKGRYSQEKLQEWKTALNSVSFNVGGIIHNVDDEGALMKKIVDSVLKEIKNVPFVVAKHPIGLDETVKDIESTTLQRRGNHSNVQIVGIWGMGGSGKTTLAKHLYNQKYKLMDKSSFLLDVRDASSKSKLHEKQRKLLQDLGLSGISIENMEEGQGILANRLRSIRVLIVLDDVDSVDQLNALVPKTDSLGLGSLIIVTSREFEVLQGWGISSLSIYKMKPLDPFHAKQLFCWHAFLQPSPDQGFENLVKRFLKICDGLPLSLKVFGALLYGKSEKHYWEIQLQKISRILPKNIEERLKVSYNALDYEEKQIFLDTACFFIGKKRNSAIAAWDGLGWNGQHSWEQLFNKCLVELSDEPHIHMVKDYDGGGYIKMHDHLRDLGREIANHESPFRLWSPQQFINVDNEVRRIAVRGIIDTAFTNDNEEFLECSQNGSIVFKTSSVNYRLEPTSVGLKFFHVKGNYYNKIIGDLSRELVWLRWDDVEQRNLQTVSSLKNLRVLELHGKRNGEQNLEELWDTDSSAPVQLRELLITSCPKIQGFPKSIGCLQHLKKIIIEKDNIRNLPEEFCLLQSLEHLELGGSELSSLPSNFGDLRNLRCLSLRDCKKLRKLPLSFKKLTLLQYLWLSNCNELNFESDILEDMTRLVTLEILGSKQLEELPRHVTNQHSLKRLAFDIEKLKQIPDNIGQLSKLRVLWIRSRLITSLPASIGDLSSLTSLSIYGCCNLECLPESLSRLHLLQHLIMEDVGVKSLPKSFGELPSLRYLGIKGCPISELHLVAEAGLFTCLEEIYLWSTEVSKISISRDYPLEHLELGKNRHLKEIETLPNTLRRLELFRCPKLDVVPSLAQMDSLEILAIMGCYRLKKIPGWEYLGASENLRRVVLQTMSRSDFDREGFIKCMKKCPKEFITVCSGAGVDAATILNSFAFPNLSVSHSFDNQKTNTNLNFEWKWPSTASHYVGLAVLLCFIVNCRSGETTLDLQFCDSHGTGMGMELEEGKWVWTSLLTPHSTFHNDVSTDRPGWVYFMENGETTVENGVVVLGDEHGLWEAFTHLCIALAN